MLKQLFWILVVIMFSYSTKLLAQDPEFTQFYANKLYLNPAFAGSDRCPKLTMNFRNQWPALGSTYVTYSAAYDQHVDALEGGIGLHVMQDVEGDGAIATSYISGMYAYTFPVNRNFSVTGGFQATYIHKKLNWDFIFPDMIDPLYGPIFPTNEVIVPTDNTDSHFDFSAGAIAFNRDYFFGLAIHHLTEPPESWRGASDAVLPRKYTLHFGTNIPIKARGYRKGELYVSPNFLFQQQKDFQQFNYGLYVYRKNLIGGIWFRQNFKFHFDSFVMMLGFKQKNFSFGYSYDVTVSKLKNHRTLGAHEVSVAYMFKCPSKKQRFRTISCPSF